MTYNLIEMTRNLHILQCVLDKALRQSTECGVRTITKPPLVSKYERVWTEGCLNLVAEQVSRWNCVFFFFNFMLHITL
jgi:hypothetical protein